MSPLTTVLPRLRRVAGISALCLAASGPGAFGQTTTPAPAMAPAATPAPAPFGMADNSFLVEEAFNQESDMLQNIFLFIHDRHGSWAASFTQEWPVFTQHHQFSYSIPAARLEGRNGAGDVMLNYRYQVTSEGPGRPAFSPRISLLLPTGNEDRGFGAGAAGLQVNLPFSKRVDRAYFHGNVGLTIQSMRWSGAVVQASTATRTTVMSPFVAASVIVAVRPMFNLMLESVGTSTEVVSSPGETGREKSFVLSPGARFGWNVGRNQLVLGLAVPVTFSAGASEGSALFYASWEGPFRK